jgi:hypothetical protein
MDHHAGTRLGEGIVCQLPPFRNRNVTLLGSDGRHAEIFEGAQDEQQQGDGGDDVGDVEVGLGDDVALGDDSLLVLVDLGHATSPGQGMPLEPGLGPAPFEGDNGRGAGGDVGRGQGEGEGPGALSSELLPGQVALL